MTNRTIDTDTGEIFEDEALDRRRAEDMLAQAWEAKRQRDAGASTYSILMGTNEKPGPIRDWLLAHPLDELADGELGIYVERGQTNLGDRMDLMQMAKDAPAVVVRLAELGLLSCNMTAWRAHPKDFIEAEDAKRFVMPGGAVPRFEIKERKR